MQTIRPNALPDAIAPDGSEIRILAGTSRGSSAHVRLPVGQISVAVAHRTVEEIWYTLSGQGEFWRSFQGDEEVIDVSAGASFGIPTGAHFQFRSTGAQPLEFVIVTMPPWPGEHEAYPVVGRWTVTQSS